MLENSILNEELIKKIIFDNYGLNINEVKHLELGSANVYVLDNKYILKEYNVISHLAKKGLRVPKYILTKDNKCYMMYEKHIIILQLFLEGYTIENNTGEYYHINESAIVLGQLSKALEDFDLVNKEYKFDTKEDLKYMPHIYILQLVGSTFGYKQYNNDYTKTGLLKFALFRTNLCTYLYNNLDVISNRLLELDK